MIRWITEKLGTSSWEFAHALPDLHIVDVRDLVDKPGNESAAIRARIAEAVEGLARGEKVVICCDYGISRSNSIAAGVLAAAEKIPMEAAVQRVLTATGESEIKLEVLDAVWQAVEPPRQAISGSSILITGASGFIGAAITKRLRESGQTVVTPSHQEIDLLQDAIRLDLIVKKHRVGKIVHLAAPRVYTSNVSLGHMLVMLKNVLDVAVRNGLSFYYLSSWEIYSGYRTPALLADETLPARPGSTYGYAKHLSEMLIRAYVEQHSLVSLILRSSPVYGVQSDRPKFIWNFLAKARRGQEIVTHRYLNGFPALDLLHIEDLQAALFKALTSNVTGELNIGSGTLVTTAEVARLLIEKIGSSSTIRHLPIESYIGNIAMDTSRAKRLLAWQPIVHLSQGLDQYLQHEHPV